MQLPFDYVFVEFSFIESRLANVSVEVGQADAEMLMCAFYTGPAAASENVVVTCTCWVTGRYVRLSGGEAINDVSCTDDKILTLCEVEVYGFHP